MKTFLLGLLTTLTLFISTASAGRVFIYDDDTSLHLYDNCGGACYNWETHYRYSVNFALYRTVPVLGDWGLFYSTVSDSTGITDVAFFSVHHDDVTVTYYSADPGYDFNEPGFLAGFVGGAYFYRAIVKSTEYQSIFDITGFPANGDPVTDSVMVATFGATATPEPGTLALLCASLAALPILRRRDVVGQVRKDCGAPYLHCARSGLV